MKLDFRARQVPEGMRNAFNIVVSKPQGDETMGRRRRRWEDDIKIAKLQ
jgi:hypothetical protein